jgi:hypothetical protein
MEVNEVHELQEHAEHARHEASMLPVALTMTILAVLVAVVTVLGHRTHTEEVLNMVKASDTWNEYQAHKIRTHDTDLAADLVGVLTVADKERAKDLIAKYSKEKSDKKDEIENDKKLAESYEGKVEKAEKKGNHFDLGEALLEIGLVITSITLLTKNRAYWYAGMAFSVIGIVAATFGLLLK